MSGESVEKPSGGGGVPAPIEAPAEPLLSPQGPEAESIPARKFAFGARAAPLLFGAFLLFALAAAGVFFARRQLDRETIAAPQEAPSESAPEEAVIELPEPAGTPLAGEGPPQAKIFNSANEGLKAGADAIARAAPSVKGSISELPPAPDAGEGNEALQDAAKDAAKLFAPKPEKAPAGKGTEIDLSTEDPEAAVESLERAAKAQASPDFSPPGAAAHAAAGIGEALSLDVARLAGSLETERQHTERQAAEIARLNAELAALKMQGSPAAQMAKAALLFNVLAEKAKTGEPYRRELQEYESGAGATLPPAIGAGADKGLATLAALKGEFPEIRDAALAAARREASKGPVSRLGANFASLVRLRPAAPIDGRGPAAVLSRAEGDLAADDLDGALAELEGLAGAARGETAAWAAKASARAAADAALSETGRALLAALTADGAP